MNGTKHFITNGPIADVYTVFALTDKDKGAKGGITAFLVERDFPGLTVGKRTKNGIKRIIYLTGHFEDCIIPEENVIGEVGMGYISALKILAEGRIGLAARAVGSSGKLIELSAKYAKERIQFGKPIADNQAIQWMLADMANRNGSRKSIDDDGGTKD